MNTRTAPTALDTFDVESIRADFPILSERVHGNKPLVYLDNAATGQKPQAVIDALTHYYTHLNSNVHRGVHYLSQRATDAYEEARRTVQRFINAERDHEIIFTRSTTESVNIVSASLGHSFLNPGDEIIVTGMEHHSNIVPWQMACEQSGARLRVIPVSDRGELDLDSYFSRLNERTRMVALVHVSNTLGTINPVHKIIEAAHRYDVPVLLDGAQAVPHMKVDVQALDVDFYAFSGHKAFGPTGIGVLYGKESWLDRLPPYQGGGSMIKTVSFEGTTYTELPHKLEAGTPHIAGAIGMAAALDYMSGIGLDRIEAHEADLSAYIDQRLSGIRQYKQIGTATEKASVVSFLVEGVHPYDTGTILDQLGIATRTGHHCTMPLMDQYHIPGTVRASFAFYNTKSEVDALAEGIQKVIDLFL